MATTKNKKSCLVFETLGKVTDMEVMESKSDGVVRLHGVFGVCGVKNGNNRIYSKENYGKMVENLQQVIANEGCLGELEHPNTMNINLDNVSHKIESIEMDDSGTITGTIRLLDTVKGKNAKAIVEAGCPLFISSRGAGSIDESGNVTLSTIKTYDLVGTPGFSQAKLTLKESQTLECLNESLAIVYESDDLLGSDDEEDDSKKDGEEKPKEEEDSKDDEKKDDEEDKEDSKDDEEKDEEDSKEDNNNNNNKVTMEEIKNTLDRLSEKITSLEAELHVAQESLKNVKPINYEAIETWVKDEFAPMITSDIKEAIIDDVNDMISESQTAIAEGVTNWFSEEVTPGIEKYINEEFGSNVEKWITEEYTPVVEQWINEEYSATLEKWINEEHTQAIENWITEEYTQNVQDWINEELIPTQKEAILNEAYKNLDEFMESRKDDRLSQIDKMLESIDAIGANSAVNKIVEEEKNASKFKGIYVVENMPAQYAPLFNGVSEAKQNEIIRSSRMYDFTKAGVMESFWANVDFSEQPINESNNLEPQMGDYYSKIAARMSALRCM